MTKYRLTSKLATIAKKYQDIEAELCAYKDVWNFLCTNYNGNPLANIDELLNNDKDMKKLFDDMGIV